MEMSSSPLCTYLHRLQGNGGVGPPLFAPSWDLIPTFLLSTSTMLILAVVEHFGLEPLGLGLQSYLPSFGASCALALCLTTSPGAQPRALVGTHVVGAFFGLSFSHATAALPRELGRLLASAFAVSLLTPLATLFGAFQPSSSATAVLAAFHTFGAMRDAGYMFLVAPVLLGVSIIVGMAILTNNLIPWRPAYPVYW